MANVTQGLKLIVMFFPAILIGFLIFLFATDPQGTLTGHGLGFGTSLLVAIVSAIYVNIIFVVTHLLSKRFLKLFTQTIFSTSHLQAAAATAGFLSGLELQYGFIGKIIDSTEAFKYIGAGVYLAVILIVLVIFAFLVLVEYIRG